MTNDPALVVEAALFSAGRPLALDEIMAETGLKKAQVTKAVKALEAQYAERDTALEVSKAGSKWAMQVKAKAAPDAAKFAPMEIPRKVLKTLALIAYHQPLKQSELKDMIGSKVYDHVGELKEHGLISARKDGVTKILTTTEHFPEYFGLDAEDTEQVRRVLAERVGLPAPSKKQPATRLDRFEAPDKPAEEESAPEPADAEVAPEPVEPPQTA